MSTATGGEFGSAKSGSSVGDPSFTGEDGIEGCCPNMPRTLTVMLESITGELDGQQFPIHYDDALGLWKGALSVCGRVLTFTLIADSLSGECSILWGVANAEMGVGEPPSEICIAFDSSGGRTNHSCDPLLLIYDAKDATIPHDVGTCDCWWPNPEIVFLISQ